MIGIMHRYRDKKPPSSPHDGSQRAAMLLAIMTRYRDKRPPSSPDMEPEGDHVSHHNPQIPGQMAALQPPIWEPEGGHVSSFVVIIRRYRDKRPPTSPRYGSQRAAVSS